MKWERDGETCTDKTPPKSEVLFCRFSIFYCGCKQPKSIHFSNLAAKVRRNKHTTKKKAIFFQWDGRTQVFEWDVPLQKQDIPPPFFIGPPTLFLFKAVSEESLSVGLAHLPLQALLYIAEHENHEKNPHGGANLSDALHA